MGKFHGLMKATDDSWLPASSQIVAYLIPPAFQLALYQQLEICKLKEDLANFHFQMKEELQVFHKVFLCVI